MATEKIDDSMARGGRLKLPYRRGGWRIPLFQGRLETFMLIEGILVVTAYLFHVLQAVQGGLGADHLVIWTGVIGAFILIEWTEDAFASRGHGALYIAARLALATGAIWLTHVDFITTFLFYVVVANAWGIGQRIGIGAALGSAIAVYGVMFLLVGTSAPQEYVHLLPWIAGLCFIVGTTQLAKREQEARARSEALLVELTAAHRQLQEYAAQAGQLATTEERNRIAREIHDSLGHYLTIVNVQLETALALRERDPARADRATGEAKRLASEALADVRRSVAALRPSALEGQTLRDAIEGQVAEFRAHSGLPIELRIEGDEARCSQAAGLALYRATQEGLTNIRKHAGASHVGLQLHFGPLATELIITDDGRGLPAETDERPRDGGGFGLTGIRERATVLGGTLELHAPQGGGTELRLTLPCAAPR